MVNDTRIGTWDNVYDRDIYISLLPLYLSIYLQHYKRTRRRKKNKVDEEF